MSADTLINVAELLAVPLLVAANGFFVAAEFSLVGMRRSRVEEMAANNSGSGRILLRAVTALDANLAATQLGVTLSSLALGWVGEPALAELLQPLLRRVSLGDTLIHVIAGGLAFVLITSLHIVLGELAPKNLALQRTEATAVFIIRPLTWFYWLFRPAILALNALGTGVLRLFGLTGDGGQKNLHSTDELKLLVTASTEGGLIQGSQKEVVERAFDMTTLKVRAIMTPRRQVVWMNADGDEQSRLDAIRDNKHALTLVARGKLDALLGVVRKQDMLDAHLHGRAIDPLALLLEPVIVHDGATVLHVLDLFKHRPVQMGVVVDEYGVVQGVVTQANLLEAMAGDIPQDDEDDPVVAHEDGSFLVDGAAPFVEVMRRLTLPTNMATGEFQTVAGFCLHHLGGLPVPGDSFELEEWRFEIADVDGMRIDKIRAGRVIKD